MAAKIFDRLADELRDHREAVFRRIAETEEDVVVIAGLRDTELEERAQEDHLIRLLSRLDERGRREIEAIDAALRRLREGRYGVCLSCGVRIPVTRLRILPATELCRACAEERERELRTGRTEPMPMRHPGEVAPDFAGLNDVESGQALRQLVREDGRIDADDLRIVVRHGIVHLRGSLPSEAEHQILLALVKDVAGFAEVEDRLEIAGLDWQRDDEEGPEPGAPEPPAGFVETAADDVASSERGVDWEPPAAPTPEQEPEEET
jgi:RNA polymerase-binding transcription factor DksA